MSCDWEWGSLAHSDFAAHWCWAYHCNHFSFNFWTKALTVHLVGPDSGQWEAEGELWWRSTFRPFFYQFLSPQSSSLWVVFYPHLTEMTTEIFTVPNDHKVSEYVGQVVDQYYLHEYYQAGWDFWLLKNFIFSPNNLLLTCYHSTQG